MPLLLSGGPLSGYRTHILGAMFALQAFAQWLAGEATLATFAERIDEMLGGLGVMAGRAALQKLIVALKALHDSGALEPRNSEPPRS